MKKLFCVISTCILLTNCSSYHTMPKFYERYKDSPNVEAYRLPKFKKHVMDSFSVYTRNLMLDVSELYYLKLNEPDVNNNELLKIEIKGLVKHRFRDLEREVDNDSLKIVAFKVKNHIAEEFLAIQNNGGESTLLYLGGDMDPMAVRDFYSSREYNKMIRAMLPDNFVEIDANLKAVEEKAEILREREQNKN